MLELLAMAVDTSYRVPKDCEGFKISFQFYPAWENFPYSAWIEIDQVTMKCF